jgi:hypothetical protein
MPWQPLKGISIKNIYVPELSYPITKKIYKFKGAFRACGVIDTACTIFAFENQSNLGKFAAEFKKALSRESGAELVVFDEKNRGSKIS